MNPIGELMHRHALMLNPMLSVYTPPVKIKRVKRKFPAEYFDCLNEQQRIEVVYSNSRQEAYYNFIVGCKENTDLWNFICNNYETVRELINDLPRLIKENKV